LGKGNLVVSTPFVYWLAIAVKAIIKVKNTNSKKPIRLTW